MANKKITSMTDIVTLATADEFPVADVSASTTNTYCTTAEVKTFVWTAPVFAAGTASANTWPKFTSGTILTTAEDGAWEVDTTNIYACTDAGNRGIIPLTHFIRTDSTNTLTSSTATQKLYASPTNGTITLETGVYNFKSTLRFTAMAGTNGNLRVFLKGSGTATTGKVLMHWWGTDNNSSTGTTRAQSGTLNTSTTSAALVSIVSANTATVLEMSGRGTFEVSGAGTMIPSVALSTAAAAILAIGSFFEFTRLGAASVVSVGQWT